MDCKLIKIPCTYKDKDGKERKGFNYCIEGSFGSNTRRVYIKPCFENSRARDYDLLNLFAIEEEL